MVYISVGSVGSYTNEHCSLALTIIVHEASNSHTNATVTHTTCSMLASHYIAIVRYTEAESPGLFVRAIGTFNYLVTENIPKQLTKKSKVV